VTAATDTGHSAALEAGASFALNRQKLLDFGFRSLHVTAETAKMLARTYYGAGPTKSYYEGCSVSDRDAPSARLLDAGIERESVSRVEAGAAGGEGI
jgi:feruloyl esterase